jgi:hypothetical protein
MPKRKKVKGKSSTKTAKATARRRSATVKRKKSAKRASLRRTSPKVVRPKAASKVKPKAVSPSAQPLKQPVPREQRIGVVTHYYGHLSVATLRLETGALRIGDVIHIRGHTTDLSQKVESLEVNHAPATEVGPNDDFGLKVVGHVREHDVVYKVLP